MKIDYSLLVLLIILFRENDQKSVKSHLEEILLVLEWIINKLFYKWTTWRVKFIFFYNQLHAFPLLPVKSCDW